MSMYPESQTKPVQLEYGTDGVSDRTVFNFFNTVYAWMCVGLVVTALVAFVASQSAAIRSLMFGTGYFTIIALMLGAWALAYAAQRAALQIGATAGTILFMVYASLIGLMISWIFIVYPVSTLLSAFVITAGTFGATSLYGFITKRDLSTMGSFCVMGIIGLFLASIVNVFIANDALSWIITYAVLALFIGLTAWETQNLRNLAIEHGHDGNMASRLAIMGSIVLYISFINMFMSILRIFGDRR